MKGGDSYSKGIEFEFSHRFAVKICLFEKGPRKTIRHSTIECVVRVRKRFVKGGRKQDKRSEIL